MLTLLMSRGILFASVDVLAEEAIRNGIKKFGGWPTFPQLWVEGKLVGGLDIAKELDEEGELIKLIPQSARVKAANN